MRRRGHPDVPDIGRIPAHERCGEESRPGLAPGSHGEGLPLPLLAISVYSGANLVDDLAKIDQNGCPCSSLNSSKITVMYFKVFLKMSLIKMILSLKNCHIFYLKYHPLSVGHTLVNYIHVIFETVEDNIDVAVKHRTPDGAKFAALLVQEHSLCV